MAADVKKMHEEKRLLTERKKMEKVKLREEMDKHTAHLRKLRLEEQEYFLNIQRESEQRFNEKERKEREQKEARQASIAAKVHRMERIHESHQKLMAEQSKKEELGRAETQARRDAETQAKKERLQTQRQAMFDSITQMRLAHLECLRREQEEEERFAAIVIKDSHAYHKELAAKKNRKKMEIVRRREELDALVKRDANLNRDREVSLDVLAINKDLLTKVKRANIGDVDGYLKKVAEYTPKNKTGRRSRTQR